MKNLWTRIGTVLLSAWSRVENVFALPDMSLVNEPEDSISSPSAPSDKWVGLLFAVCVCVAVVVVFALVGTNPHEVVR